MKWKKFTVSRLWAWLILKKKLVIFSVSIVAVCFVGIFLLLTYSKTQWCVNFRNFVCFVIIGCNPEIPSDFTGTWKNWWGIEYLAERIEVRDGIRHGRFTSWYEGGQISCEGFYKNGQREGKWTFWHRNGQKRLEVFRKNNQDHGKEIRWDENGNVVSIIWKYEGQPVSKERFEQLTEKGADYE